MTDSTALLAEAHQRWSAGRGRHLHWRLTKILEAYERIQSGQSRAGDGFSIYRHVLKLFRSVSAKDAAWLMLQLADQGEEATFPFELLLRKRSQTKSMRAAARKTQAEAASRKRAHRDESIFLRVIDHRAATGASLPEAIKVVANGEDGPLGLLSLKPMVHSTSLVRAIYMRHIGSAKQTGLVKRHRGLFGSRMYFAPLPLGRAKGRPRSKK